MEWLQVIMLLCGHVDDFAACERHYWDCYQRRADIVECAIEEPYNEDRMISELIRKLDPETIAGRKVNVTTERHRLTPGGNREHVRIEVKFTGKQLPNQN